MANLKSLAKDTAIYGMSSVIGRPLNYLLIPLYTAKISAASGGYGVITNIYAYTALLLVALVYGMETTLFCYANKTDRDPKKVYSTILSLVGLFSLLFIAMVFVFLQPTYGFAGYSERPLYVWVMVVTVAIDAFQVIPFAYLRYKRRPIKFATSKLLFIVLNIILNPVYYFILDGHEVGYALYINLVCTTTITFCLWKELKDSFFAGGKLLDMPLTKKVLSYTWPTPFLGIAGIPSQTTGYIIFPYVYKDNDVHTQLGIFGAVSRIVTIMSMITQAFRCVYEPFVFGKARDKDNKETYARAMKFFIILTPLVFLAVMGYMNILRHVIDRDYWVGPKVMPIVMAGDIMTGIYFNFSSWYKFIDKMIWGAYFSGIGCAVIIGINAIFVPKYGYIARVWVGFMGNATAMVPSYPVGQRKYPINYPLRNIFVYLLIAGLFFAVIAYTNVNLPVPAALGINILVIILFIAHVLYHGFPLQKLCSRFAKK